MAVTNFSGSDTDLNATLTAIDTAQGADVIDDEDLQLLAMWAQLLVAVRARERTGAARARAFSGVGGHTQWLIEQVAARCEKAYSELRVYSGNADPTWAGAAIARGSVR